MGHGELPSTSTQMNLTTRPHPPLWVSQNDFFLNTARIHIHRPSSIGNRAAPQGLSRLPWEQQAEIRVVPGARGRVSSLFSHRLDAGHGGPPCSCFMSLHTLLLLLFSRTWGNLFPSLSSAFHRVGPVGKL